jgi:hypothetical protein
MKKTSFGTSLGVKGVSLAMILTSSFFPTTASHALKTSANPFAPGAIGIIESAGALTINGRPAQGSFTLWGDELVNTTAGARIVFGSLGEVRISPGASVQLKMENAKLHEAAGSQAFAAQLFAGELNVKLRHDAGALVNSVASEFTASKGSDFKVDLREGRATIQTHNGTVLANTNTATNTSVENITTTKKDAAYLAAAKKLEKLIGNFKLTVPSTVVAEAARRAHAMDDLSQRRAAFMRSLSLTSTATFFAERTTKPNATALERSIGAAESLNGLLVNGRLTAGREMLWGGETLEAPQGSGARLSFTSIGQVVLNSGAKARLTTESVGVPTASQTTQRVLAAQLLSGDLQIRFDQTASGYVRAGESVMAATRGANFRVEMREGNGAVDVTNGAVMVIGNWPLLAPPVMKDEASGKTSLDTKGYKIVPANLSAGFNVGVNKSHAIHMRVTDERNKPVADVHVKFTVKGAGSLGAIVFASNTIEVKTDARGIATVPYNASANVGTSAVTAEVPGTTATATTTANVTTQDASFYSRQGMFPALVTLVAAFGIGAAVYFAKDRTPDIQPRGDTLVVP